MSEKIDYTKLDAAIVKAIKEGRSPLYDNAANAQASIISVQTKRESFRVIDVRLQALRKAGVIWYASKSAAPDKTAGWKMKDGAA